MQTIIRYGLLIGAFWASMWAYGMAATLTSVQENIMLIGMRQWGGAVVGAGNGGTVTFDGEDAIFKTNGPTGYAYATLNVNSVIPINRAICVSMTVQNAGDAFTRNNIAMLGTYTIAAGKTISKIPIPTVSGDRVGQRFILSAVAGTQLRIGIDVLQEGGEGSDRTLIVRRPVVEVIDPLAPSRSCYGEGLPAHSANVLPYRADVSFKGGATQDYGVMIFNRIYTQPIPPDSYGIIIGDSFSIAYLTPIGWPNIVRSTRKDIAFRELAKGGIALSQIAGWIEQEMRVPAETDPNGVAPSFAIVQGGINDVITGTYNALALNSMIVSMEKILTTLTANGIKKIVTVNIAPFGNHVNYSLARGDDETILRYNQWLQTTAQTRGYGYVDQYAQFKDATDPRKLSSTVDQGDGLHLNATGHAQLAELILAEFDRIRQ